MSEPSTTAPTSSVEGGASAESTCWLDLYVAESRQLFNSMDPAPFRERDLDPKAFDYIVDWAREAPANRRLGVAVRLGQASSGPGEAGTLSDAMHEYFRRRALGQRKQLRQLFRTGRISLVIGLVFLGGAVALGEFLAGLLSKEGYGWLVKESLVIGGWVALWRPMEIFLYDWWPIRAEARLYERLSVMDVRLQSADAASANRGAT